LHDEFLKIDDECYDELSNRAKTVKFAELRFVNFANPAIPPVADYSIGTVGTCLGPKIPRAQGGP